MKIERNAKFTYRELDVDGVQAQIGVIVKEDGTLRNRIQNVGLNIVSLWGKRKIEPGKAAELVNALVQSSPYHGKAVSNWFAMNTPLRWSDENKGFYAHVEDKVNGDNFKAMRDEPFWEASPPPNPKPFNLPERLQSLLQQAKKKRDAGVTEEDDIPDDLVRAISLVMAGGTVTAPEPNF